MNYLNTSSINTQVQIPLYTNVSQQSSVEQPKINTIDSIGTIDTNSTIGTTDTNDVTSTMSAMNIYDNAVNFFSPSS
jgi:hypothetical protein